MKNLKIDCVKNVLNNSTSLLNKRSPEVLTGLGIAGFITTIFTACKATPEAINKMEEIESESTPEDTNKEIMIRKIKGITPIYLPSVILGTSSTICIISSLSIANRRTAAAIAAYTISEERYKDYRDKVVETIGKKKEQAIQNEIAQDTIENSDIDEILLAEYIPEAEDVLCYDKISGRYFYSNPIKIKEIETCLNKQLFVNMFVSLNDYYYELGINPTQVGDSLGWNAGDDISFSFSSGMLNDNKTVLVVDCSVSPRINY